MTWGQPCSGGSPRTATGCAGWRRRGSPSRSTQMTASLREHRRMPLTHRQGHAVGTSQLPHHLPRGCRVLSLLQQHTFLPAPVPHVMLLMRLHVRLRQPLHLICRLRACTAATMDDAL